MVDRVGLEAEYEHYRDSNGDPRTLPASVLYLDVLGTRDAIQNAATATAHLQVTRAAVDRAREMGSLTPDMPQIARWFSDNLVVAERSRTEMGFDLSPGFVVLTAAWVQIALFLDAGIFARGGIAAGDFYADPEIVYGPALIEAYELEVNVAHFPRIVISDGVAQVLQADKKSGSGIEQSMLLTDGDGVSFVNYLGHLEFHDDAVDESLDVLKEHRTRISDALAKSAGKTWHEKNEWLAAYHDFFCQQTLPDEIAGPLLLGVSHPKASFTSF